VCVCVFYLGGCWWFSAVATWRYGWESWCSTGAGHGTCRSVWWWGLPRILSHAWSCLRRKTIPKSSPLVCCNDCCKTAVKPYWFRVANVSLCLFEWHGYHDIKTVASISQLYIVVLWHGYCFYLPVIMLRGELCTVSGIWGPDPLSIPSAAVNDLAYSERTKGLIALLPRGPVHLSKLWWLAFTRDWTGWNPSWAVVWCVSNLLSASMRKLVLYIWLAPFILSIETFSGHLMDETQNQCLNFCCPSCSAKYYCYLYFKSNY